MLTDYDIRRLSASIVEQLMGNRQFIEIVTKTAAQRKGTLNSTQAASYLGLSRKTVCDIAEWLGGFRSGSKSSHWVFPVDTLTENYKNYITNIKPQENKKK